jgi:anti-sigma B factor antagonist
VSEQEVDDAPANRLSFELLTGVPDPSLCVIGEIDVFTAPILADRLADLTSSAASLVRLDLDGVTFIDSTGLRVLIESDRLMRDRDAVLVLARPSRAVARLLELTALGDFLTVERSITPGP